MTHPLRCRCGTIQGFVSPSGMVKRALCYCRDCQTFAHFLERANEILDEQGGTEIVATFPRNVRFTAGMPALACMSLSDRGLLRWYASCCNTPIGNTPRDFKVAYVGLISTCLASHSPSLQESFGPLRMALNTKSAKGPVKSTPLSNVLGLLSLMKSMIGARLSRKYEQNPFFAADTGAPVRSPRVLTKSERDRFTPA